MATKRSTDSRPSSPEVRDISIVEMQLMIVPRGRSVMHGTLLRDGQIRQFEREVDAIYKMAIEDALAPLLESAGT